MNSNPPKTRPVRAAPPRLARQINDVVANLAQQSRLGDPALAREWGAIVGTELAALARPGKLLANPGGAKTLELHAVSSAAAAKLKFEEKTILAMLRTYLGHSAIAALRIINRQSSTQPVGLSRFRGK